jgi:hypothetical protein
VIPRSDRVGASLKAGPALEPAFPRPGPALEIAEAAQINQGDLSTMSKTFIEIGNLAESNKSLANHATGFEPMFYNIWKQQTKTEGSSHFGKQ